MRIVSKVHRNNGVSLHRLILPLNLMDGVDTCVTSNLLEEHFEKGCDIFMYNRVLPEHAMPKIYELKEKYGFKICVDIDDHWLLDKHHILYDEYTQNDFASEQIRHLKEADIVLTTHSRLADEILPYNKNVHVCPNAIPHRGQFDIERVPHHLVRLFWQGSDTHEADLNILEHPIGELKKIAGKIKMIMGGLTEPGMKEGDIELTEDHETVHISRRMAWIYTAGFNHQYKLIRKASVFDYYKPYSEADICLVPLVNSPFNGFKSNLKVLEAANLALPVIASKVDPYLDMPINYCRRSSDWVGHIKRLVQFPARRREEGLRLKEWADENYNFEKINNERKQILEYEARKQTVSR